MAYLLKQNGFEHVTIMERTNELGGKSQTLRYRGTDQALSTIFFNAAYQNTLIPLLQKFGLFEGNTVPATTQTYYWSTNDPNVRKTILNGFIFLLVKFNFYPYFRHQQ